MGQNNTFKARVKTAKIYLHTPIIMVEKTSFIVAQSLTDLLKVTKFLGWKIIIKNSNFCSLFF